MSVPTYLSVLLIGILSLVLLPPTQAKTRLHLGPRGHQPEKILRGFTTSIADPTDRSGALLGESTSQVVDFAIHIMQDILLWEELVKDGVMFESCSFKPGSRFSQVRLSGSRLDITDFDLGVVFSIDKGDFELNCQMPVLSVPGIDDADNILFFKIINKVVKGPDTVLLSLQLVPGRFVVPEVDVWVREETVQPGKPEFAIFDDDSDLSPSTGILIQPPLSNNTLPTVDRASAFRKTIRLGTGVTFNVNARVSVRLFSFKIVRLRSLEFRWEQTLSANLRAVLDVRQPFRKNANGEISRFYIPRLSFRAGIPLVGKLQAGAFVGLDYVVEVLADVKLRARVSANFRRHEEVIAKLAPPGYRAVNKLSFRKRAFSSGFITVESRRSATVDGFAGVRPVIGVGLTYTRSKIAFKRFRPVIESKSVDGRVGASFGARLTVGYRKPPFRPYQGKRFNGICKSCHSVRASLRFIGKDLSAELVLAEEAKRTKVIVPFLFGIDLGTLCLIKSNC